MDDNPTSILEEIASGSLEKVIEENNKLILIDVETIKVKNKVLRQFVEQAREDGLTDEAIVDILLIMDESVEENNVKKTLNQYL